MATNIGAQSAKLDHDIYDLSETMRRDPAVRNRGSAKLGRCFLTTSETLESMRELMSDVASLAQVRAEVERTKKIFEGLRVMRNGPQTFHSVDRYIEWEKIMKGRRSDARKREVSIQNRIMAMSDPVAFHELSLRREYGDAGAEQILSAERNEARKRGQTGAAESKIRGRYSYWYDTLSAQEQRRWDYTQKYGGGTQGRMYADARIQEENNKALHETKGRIASRNRKLTVQMMKEFPVFFANSKRSTKDIKDMARGMRKIEKIPILGKTFKAMAKDPITTGLGISAVLGAILNSIMTKSDTANEKVSGWINTMNLFGTPSGKFTQSALFAGMKDPSAISRKFGEATFKYGNADTFYANMGRVFANAKDPRMKMAIAQKLGFDETDVMLAEIHSGHGSKYLDKPRRTAAQRAKADLIETTGFASGSGVLDTLQSLWFGYAPGAKSMAARDAVFYETMNAADSANRYSAESAKSTGGSNVTITIGGINIDGAEASGKSLIDLVLKYGPESKDVLDSIDPRAR